MLWTREVYHQLVADGKCVQCGDRDATPGETMCDWCRDEKARRNRLNHARALLRGCCPRHRSRKVAKGYRQCQECVDADRARKQGASHGH